MGNVQAAVGALADRTNWQGDDGAKGECVAAALAVEAKLAELEARVAALEPAAE